MVLRFVPKSNLTDRLYHLREELRYRTVEDNVWDDLHKKIPYERMEQLCVLYDEMWRIQYPSDLGYLQEEFDEILMKKHNAKSILAIAVAGISKMHTHIKRIEFEIAELGDQTQYTWRTAVQGRLDAAVLRTKMRKLQALRETCESHMREAEKRSDAEQAYYERNCSRAVASYKEAHPWEDDDDLYRDYMEDHKIEDPLEIRSFTPFKDLMDFIFDEAYGPHQEVDMTRILPKWNGKSEQELDAELVERFGDDAATIKVCTERQERHYKSVMYRCACEVSEIVQTYFSTA
jgi:hypothetical protein